MTTWTRDELDSDRKSRRAANSLHSDATAHRKAGDDLGGPRRRRALRPVRERAHRPWFRGAQIRHEGRISAGGIAKEVIFTDADPGLNDDIDAAYRVKYRRYQARIVDSIVSR